MSKFLMTAMVASVFALGSVAPASAVEIANEDDKEYSINLYTHIGESHIVKTFKLMPKQSLKGLCGEVCSLQIDNGSNNFASHEAVAETSKVKVRNGRIVRN